MGHCHCGSRCLPPRHLRYAIPLLSPAADSWSRGISSHRPQLPRASAGKPALGLAPAWRVRPVRTSAQPSRPLRSVAGWQPLNEVALCRFQELTEDSIKQSDEMVDQLEKAEVSEEKRAVFRALTSFCRESMFYGKLCICIGKLCFLSEQVSFSITHFAF